MAELEQTLDSTEIANMIEKEHSKLLRDIRRYVEQFNEAKIGFVDFFKESTYVDAKGETRPCYRITKKGCEFIAHKLTGTKGTIFTARYINRFHEMQDIISAQKLELPWFIREFKGSYVVLERDFITITGVDITKHKLFYRQEYFIGGLDVNGCGWKCDNEKFKEKYGFDFGDDDCMMYLHLSGVRKALAILADDRKVHMNPGACELIQSEVDKILKFQYKRRTEKEKKAIESQVREAPVQINIIVKDGKVQLA